jgi:hypothetical protein
VSFVFAPVVRPTWARPASYMLGAAVTLALGCGPMTPTGGASDSDDGSTTRHATISSDPTMSTPDSNDGTSTADPTGSTGPAMPPGRDCVRTPRTVEPPTPDGCEPVWLVDADGEPIEGAHSGLVRCPAPRASDFVVYRTAAVECPELIGEECLCDADCPRGRACICANEATTLPAIQQYASNRCLPSDCASTEDCGQTMCRTANVGCLGIWYPYALRCTTPSDDCIFDSDCTSSQFCAYDHAMELFTCEPGAVCE